jgi:histidinol dehydrogenase
VSPDEIGAGVGAISTAELRALETAIDNVRRHHATHLPSSSSFETVPGVVIESLWSPVGRVGAYVPGGKAAYPSSLVMTVVPAQVAGVESIAVATPCDDDGQLHPLVLAAASLLGVDDVYAMGGSQAIAALAHGTDTVEPVDKIVGPGNAWVTAAKLAVLGTCAIDLPAGPSEVLVIADATADPDLVAIDLLCQAEHGSDSPAVLVTTDSSLGQQVLDAIDRLLPTLGRQAILRKALETHGEVLVVADLVEAVRFANEYAAEHVTVLTTDATATASTITNAGSVYVGRWSPESAGDYATGANHVLPTGGLARTYGPLSVSDFGSWRQVQTLTESGLATLRPTIETLAAAEGLDAHRLSTSMRFRTDTSLEGQ